MSIKPNMGHAEGASGVTAVLKAVLALEHRTIPPSIKAWPLNPKIPLESLNSQLQPNVLLGQLDITSLLASIHLASGVPTVMPS
jgi:3-oxoacyl-(acyl-carrier-protein) synthase